MRWGTIEVALGHQRQLGGGSNEQRGMRAQFRAQVERPAKGQHRRDRALVTFSPKGSLPPLQN
jgi:hypothetical protein